MYAIISNRRAFCNTSCEIFKNNIKYKTKQRTRTPGTLPCVLIHQKQQRLEALGKMEVKKGSVEKLISSTLNQSRLEPEQIPELDLYVDQILMLFEDKLGDTRRHEKDKILTKSMVNNYSKERLIRPMHGKKYSREQILQILLICNLKNMMSIGDIKQVMTLLMEEGIRADGLEEIFEKNRVNQDKLKQGISGIVGGLKENYAEEMDTKAVVSLLLSLAGISSYCKRTSEAIIDQFFVQDEKTKPSK